MEFKECYLDIIFVPLGLVMFIAYHFWLWHKVRSHPLSTVLGTNFTACRYWVVSIMKDNDKKGILAVQTLRNSIMGSTLMATTSILLSTGLAAILSSSYTIKKPLNDSILGQRGEFMVAVKYISMLCIFLFSFFCHSLSIRFMNQANILINTPQDPVISAIITPEYVSEILDKGFLLNTVGNRLFYSAMPLLLWIFGPLLVFFCFSTMIPVLFNLDILYGGGGGKTENGNGKGGFESV